MTTKLAIDGLNSLDLEELKQVLGKESLEAVEPTVPEGTLAEPATITVILTLTPVVAGLIATWISKPRRKKITKRKIRIVRPDGSVEEKEWEIVDAKEDAIKSQVLAQITKWFKP